MKASLIIVNYNDKLRVGRAIMSCLNQDYDNVEVIVVDDGSDKETRELYKKFEGIKLIQLERDDPNKRTVPRALNAGLEASTGDYVAVLGSDDYFHPEYVSKLIRLNGDINFCNWEIIGLKYEKIDISKYWKFDNILQDYLLYNQLSHECMLCKRKVIEAVGKYDERLPRSQDCDWIVRAILKGFTWDYCQDYLVYVEKHETDQQKNLASIHGKTLWSLKNNINIQWILNFLKSGHPHGILSYYMGIHDFCTRPEWKEDFDKSEFKQVYDNFLTKLKKERCE
jgi:glycosyltransferase involved in cell wall biosynthesis